MLRALKKQLKQLYYPLITFNFLLGCIGSLLLTSKENESEASKQRVKFLQQAIRPYRIQDIHKHFTTYASIVHEKYLKVLEGGFVDSYVPDEKTNPLRGSAFFKPIPFNPVPDQEEMPSNKQSEKSKGKQARDKGESQSPNSTSGDGNKSLVKRPRKK